MKVEMQLELAQKTIVQRDQRIEELEQLVQQLQVQKTQHIEMATGIPIDQTVANGQQYHDQQQYYDETAVTYVGQHRLLNQADTDKDLNEREEFTVEE